MPQVSKKKLKPKIEKRVNDALVKIFSRIGSSDERENFLNEFLKPTEKAMLAKRLALIILIMRGYSLNQLEQILGMSRSTVLYYNRLVKKDYFQLIKKLARIKTKQKNINQPLDVILSLGLMPPQGKGRWKWLYKN